METLKPQLKKVKFRPFNWNETNVQFEKLTNDLRLLGLPSIDSDLVNTCGNDTKSIVRAVIAGRFTKYWERPDNTITATRRQITYDAWKLNESRLASIRESCNISSAVKHSRLSKEIGYKVLKILKKNYYPIDFGPGESFKTQKGCTHLASKLDPYTHSVSNKNLQLWVSVITSTHGLFKPYMQIYVRALYGHTIQRVVTKNNPDWKRDLVMRVIETIPDYIVYGSRQAQVPKDNDENRVIEVNPLGDVVCQKVIGWAFRQVLLDYGIDLDKNQDLHNTLISQSIYTTLDAKKASDSIIYEHIHWLFPRELSNMLQTLSQEFILVDGVYVKQEKLCSMGSGFTFELLTTIFLTICRTYDPDAVVYGDDIICLNKHADSVIQGLESLGFMINLKKSFVNSVLRESCGGFFLDDYGYITTFKFTYSNNSVEAIAAINKLRRVIEHYIKTIGNDDFVEILQKYHEEMTRNVPPEYLGPLMPRCKPWSKKQGPVRIKDYVTEIVTWVEHPKWLYRKRKSALIDTIRKENFSLIEGTAWNYQYAFNDLHAVLIPEIHSKVDIRKKNKLSYSPLIYSYIKQGKRSDFVMTGHGQRTVTKLRFIDPYLSLIHI